MYKESGAQGYWSDRAEKNQNISAVLNIGLPDFANYVFDKWFSYLLHRFIEKDMRILDAACGVGRVLVPLAKNGYQMVGLDLSPKMLDICRENSNSVGITKNVKLLQGSVGEIPFKTGTFDVVILSEILFHLPDNLCRQAIEECSRVLKGDGLAIVTTNNKKSIFLKNIGTATEQRKDGYFFTVRDIDVVNSWFKKSSLFEIYRRSNGFVSMLNGARGILGLRRLYSFSSTKIRPLLKAAYLFALKLDMSFQPTIVEEKLATLFFLVYRKR